MTGYIIRRMISSALVLVLTTMAVFALFWLGPNNPAQPICDQGGGGRCTPQRLENIEKAMGLDKSVAVAYGEFAKGLVVDRTIFVGSAEYDCQAPCLGISYAARTQVRDELFARYPATLSLAVGGAIIYLLVGVVTGVTAARYRGSFSDRALVASTLVVSSMPYYVLALLAWIFLTQRTAIFPNTTYNPITENPALWAGGLLLPWLVLGLTSATQYSRFTRGQMVETMSEDYIRTATAKGVSTNKVVFKHGLRAAIIPVVTIFGLDFATLLGGTVFTEEIFRIDGIGRWGLDAIQPPSDIPIVTATVLAAAFFIVMANLVVDVVYSVLDPRVRLS